MARTPGAKDITPRQKRTDKPIDAVNNPEVEPGYNAKRIAFTMAILPKEPLDPNDIAEMERRFENYLKLCAEYDMKIGNQAAYAAIGIDKGTAWDWENRNQGNPARSYFIKKVRQICAMYREGLMEDGKVNPVTGIFWQKNYDGMKDQQEVVLTPNQNPLGDQPNMEALKQKYLDNASAFLPESAEGAEVIAEIPAEPQKAQKGRRKTPKAD